MCTKTVRSYTNARYVSAVSPQKFINYWKCGFCSECINEKRSEFQLRSYYESKRCLSRPGSFILFDTLTYRDENLKFFSDYYPAALGQPWNFCAFSHYDVTQFFKQLNTTLERLGYDVRGNMTHLLTSEYGSRPGCTHRPHYHVLFFVNFKIEPVILSYIIGELWHHGRTDGAWYKGENYVKYQRVFRSCNSDLLKVSNYVAKYVGKDLYLHSKLMRRCVRSFYEMHPDWIHSYELRKEFRRFCSQVLPFHLQSDGFGLAALDFVDEKDIVSSDSLPMPLSGPGVVARIPLPLYYRRKMFYSVKKIEGRSTWCLSEKGRQHMVSSFERRVQNLRSKILAFDQHCDADRYARYHLLRRGLLMDRLSVALSDDELLSQVYDSDIEQLDFLKNQDLVYYNYGTEKFSYWYGRHLTDMELTGVPWFDHCLERPHRAWSPREFELSPPDGLVIYSDPECDAFLDNFFSWLRLNGDSMDFVNWKKDKFVDHYKEIGLLDEFVLK